MVAIHRAHSLAAFLPILLVVFIAGLADSRASHNGSGQSDNSADRPKVSSNEEVKERLNWLIDELYRTPDPEIEAEFKEAAGIDDPRGKAFLVMQIKDLVQGFKKNPGDANIATQVAELLRMNTKKVGEIFSSCSCNGNKVSVTKGDSHSDANSLKGAESCDEWSCLWWHLGVTEKEDQNALKTALTGWWAQNEEPCYEYWVEGKSLDKENNKGEESADKERSKSKEYPYKVCPAFQDDEKKKKALALPDDKEKEKPAAPPGGGSGSGSGGGGKPKEQPEPTPTPTPTPTPKPTPTPMPPMMPPQTQPQSGSPILEPEEKNKKHLMLLPLPTAEPRSIIGFGIPPFFNGRMAAPTRPPGNMAQRLRGVRRQPTMAVPRTAPPSVVRGSLAK